MSTSFLQEDCQLIKEIVSPLDDTLEITSPKIPPKQTHITPFYYTQNRDKSIRFLFKTTNIYPGFLDMYNNSSIRAKLYKCMVRLVFLIPILKRLVFKTLYVHSSEPLSLFEDKTLKAYQKSIFLGTKGKERNILVALSTHNGVKTFLKHPLRNPNSNKAWRVSNYLTCLQIKGLSVPDIEKIAQGHLQENIRPDSPEKNDQISTQHLRVYKALFSKTRSLFDLQIFSEKTTRKLQKIDKSTPHFNVPFLTHLLSENLAEIDLSKKTYACFKHGDFTPWNSYLSKSSLCMFDFEHAEFKGSYFYDVFHFIMQSEVLLGQRNFKDILPKLKEAFHNKRLPKKIKPGTFSHYFRLYILDCASQFLVHYSQSEKLHKQAFDLINVWQQALLWLMPKPKTRTQAITLFFSFLSDKQYALIKHPYNTVQEIPQTSDLDLILDATQTKTSIGFFKTLFGKQAVKIRGKSFMTTLHIETSDLSLAIDCIHNPVRKSLAFFTSQQLIKNRKKTQAIYRLNSTYEVAYMFFFYFLNKSAIPLKYRSYVLGISPEKKDEILRFINLRLHVNLHNLEQLFVFDIKLYFQLKIGLKKQAENHLIKRAKYALLYLIDVLFMSKDKGYVVTFSGVDGAGKSTLIEHTRHLLETRHRKRVKVLRHRPSILPILSAFKYGKSKAEQRASQRLPRLGKNQSKLSSLLRFSYYFLDYFFGQWLIKFLYTWQGYVVVYDRYYYDFISDPKRSNLLSFPKLTYYLFKWVDKPKVNLFLYAPAHVILQRKKELDAQSIGLLTHRYKQLFTRLQKQYDSKSFVSIENIDLQHTLHQIGRLISKVA